MMSLSKRTRNTLIAATAAIVGVTALVTTTSNGPGITPPPPLVIVFMENKSYTGLEAHPASTRTYLDSFAAGGIRFTNYTEGDALGHSLPDYLGLASGSRCGYTGDVTTPGAVGAAQGCPTTVWNQLEGAGVTWAVYEDAMPAPCSNVATYSNVALDTQYALKHNPATPFASIWSNQTLCKAHVLPQTAMDPANLPAVSFVAPGICNDQHGSSSTAWTNCASGTNALLTRGDAWLAARVPTWLAAGAEVIITYDESGTLYAAEQGPGITPGLVGTTLSHYGLLRAIEDRYGLTCLNGACGATPVPL